MLIKPQVLTALGKRGRWACGLCVLSLSVWTVSTYSLSGITSPHTFLGALQRWLPQPAHAQDAAETDLEQGARVILAAVFPDATLDPQHHGLVWPDGRRQRVHFTAFQMHPLPAGHWLAAAIQFPDQFAQAEARLKAGQQPDKPASTLLVAVKVDAAWKPQLVHRLEADPDAYATHVGILDFLTGDDAHAALHVSGYSFAAGTRAGVAWTGHVIWGGSGTPRHPRGPTVRLSSTYAGTSLAHRRSTSSWGGG